MFDFSPPLFLSSFMLNSLSKPRKKDRCTKNEARSAGASLYGSYFAIHYHTIQSNEQAESYQATTDSQHPAATTSGTITNATPPSPLRYTRNKHIYQACARGIEIIELYTRSLRKQVHEEANHVAKVWPIKNTGENTTVPKRHSRVLTTQHD
ncbi:hypothetical protein TMatcc_000098 [Talaromyces marneffei ATCC 18224]